MHCVRVSFLFFLIGPTTMCYQGAIVLIYDSMKFEIDKKHVVFRRNVSSVQTLAKQMSHTPAPFPDLKRPAPRGKHLKDPVYSGV